MVINWTNVAKSDLRGFLYHTHMTEGNAHLYINSLVNYVDVLEKYPFLGKVLFHIKSLEIRQLIYKKHKIIYYIQSNQIIILSVVHTS